MSPNQSAISLAAAFHEDVRNGGLIAFFSGPLAHSLDVILDALATIGARAQLSIVERWLKLLPVSVDPRKPAQVGTVLFSEGVPQQQLAALDQEYFGTVESFYLAVVNFALNHPEGVEMSPAEGRAGE